MTYPWVPTEVRVIFLPGVLPEDDLLNQILVIPVPLE